MIITRIADMWWRGNVAGELWEADEGGVGDRWGRECASTCCHSKGYDGDQGDIDDGEDDCDDDKNDDDDDEDDNDDDDDDDVRPAS